MARLSDPLERFHAPVRDWFRDRFGAPTDAQIRGWEAIGSGGSALLLAPTGSGKTLAAFLVAIDRLMFEARASETRGTRVVYVSPLKALATDIERNLRAPLFGIEQFASAIGLEHSTPRVLLRTGDTPAAERAKMRRVPPEILITTPESLFLLLTSSAREGLRTVDTVILDEIHAISGTKRGAHLAITLERLEALRGKDAPPIQRIGLSATQRPLDEIARFLGGGTIDASTNRFEPRPVTIVDVTARRPLELSVEVTLDDLPRLGLANELDGSESDESPSTRTAWPSIHARVIDLIRSHRSTIVFVNSRRLAERIAADLNELAREEIALAHHGSLAREERRLVEERLQRGDLRAMVATSSMELGIDIGFVDLVIQIEAPPSVASGLQRVGRANHSVGAVPRGVIIPKHRGELLACAAAATAMREGDVEPTFYPRHPIDVLAQQIVACVSVETWAVDELFRVVRRAAPFADLPRTSFESVLDMLSGRYPSDDFRELRARLTWDRIGDTLRARKGAQRVAIVNAGTIPDRGLYGVFIAGDGDGPPRRVGELDEEMVFETSVGDVILLGASSWRVEDITHDRVLVSPAAGEPGKMPFWRGDRPGRPRAFGERIGRLTREIAEADLESAERHLRERHHLDERAARILARHVHEEIEIAGSAPTDRTIVVQSFPDEAGDWRVCVLSPFGAAIHAPWAIAVQALLEKESALTIDAVTADDGIVFRIPDRGSAPSLRTLAIDPGDAEDLITERLASTSLFAARFRENAARALLLPRHRPGRRNPLWLQRKRAADLLAVAASFRSFPIILETFRDCLRDVFDLVGLESVLRDIAEERIRIVEIERSSPSPFAASLLFSYVGNFIYEGDAPLPERRAQALAIDHAQLRELLGESELRELFDEELIAQLEAELQHLDPKRKARHLDATHDLLLLLGDLTKDEIAARSASDGSPSEWIDTLAEEARAVPIVIAGEERWIAIEDAASYRDALGIELPTSLPESLLAPMADAALGLVSRFARTHGPFAAERIARRFGLPIEDVEARLESLESRGKVVRGAFLPNGSGEEWCDASVLQTLKRRALARLRAEIEPVEPAAFARFALAWQGIGAESARRESDPLLAAVTRLQGYPLLASALETEILPARVPDFDPVRLDLLCASGEIVWRGLEGVGAADGRIALYRRDEYDLLAPPAGRVEGDLAETIRDLLKRQGASFFPAIARATGAFVDDLLRTLWDLVWSGEVTNDTFAPLRAVLRASDPDVKKRRGRAALRSAARRQAASPPGTEGRWSLLERSFEPTDTERRAAMAQAILERHGLVTREVVQTEGVPGGFAAIYPVLRAMEEAGRIRRGYFVKGLGAAQFTAPGAEDWLRSCREAPAESSAVVLAATDPANVWGAALPWPASRADRDGVRLERRAGARVVLVDGELAAYLARGEKELVTFLADDAPSRERVARLIAEALAALVDGETRPALLIPSIDGERPERSALAPFLEAAGFRQAADGYLLSLRRDSGRLRGAGRSRESADDA